MNFRTRLKSSAVIPSLASIAVGLASVASAGTVVTAATAGNGQQGESPSVLPVPKPRADYQRTASGCKPCKPNPCSPCAPCKSSKCKPNPCNPCAAGAHVELNDAEAAAAYDVAEADVAVAYAVADDPAARSYLGWARYNTVPYVSDTHGGRLVNNYANGIASDYGKWEDVGTLPEGSVLAKDSIVIRADGGAAPGPLFLMEKMAEGFDPEYGNWRYTLIMPGGDTFGVTKGTNSDGVAFCGECHVAVEEQDHLFFLPDEYRRNPD